MSTGQSIEFTIDALGNVEMEAKGYTDGSCKAATEPFRKALGGEQDVTDKPEANIPASTQQQHGKQTW